MSEYTEYELRKIALLSKVIKDYDTMLENLGEDDEPTPKTEFLAQYNKYFELVEQ